MSRSRPPRRGSSTRRIGWSSPPSHTHACPRSSRDASELPSLQSLLRALLDAIQLAGQIAAFLEGVLVLPHALIEPLFLKVIELTPPLLPLHVVIHPRFHGCMVFV